MTDSSGNSSLVHRADLVVVEAELAQDVVRVRAEAPAAADARRRGPS
jgi:hypothetical protein